MIWVDTARQAKICKAFLNKYALPIVVQNPDSTVCYYSGRWLNLAWSIWSLRLPTSFIFQWEPSLFYSWELEHVANWTLIVQKEEDPPPWTSFSGISKKIYVKIWGGNGRLNRNDNQNWYMKVPKPLIIANNSYPNSSNWKWWKKIKNKLGLWVNYCVWISLRQILTLSPAQSSKYERWTTLWSDNWSIASHDKAEDTNHPVQVWWGHIVCEWLKGLFTL